MNWALTALLLNDKYNIYTWNKLSKEKFAKLLAQLWT